MMELRLKKLEKTKAYREGILKTLKNDTRRRKRVMIAPRMADINIEDLTCAVKNSPFPPEKNKLTSSYENGKSSGDDDIDIDSYKNWIRERKNLRQDLNQHERLSEWLSRKPSLTEIERRVHDAQIQAELALVLLNKMKQNDNELDSEDVKSSKGKGTWSLPSIDQPEPVALSVINDYLAKRHLRLLDLFLQADQDKDCKISREELIETMKVNNIPLSDGAVDNFFQIFDSNGDRLLDYKEFSKAKDVHITKQQHHHNSSKQSNAKSSTSLLKENKMSTSQISSHSLLSLPHLTNSEYSTYEKNAEKRSRRQLKRNKHRSKIRKTVENSHRCCTIGGPTGPLIDDFQKRQRREYEQIVELCHHHGLPLSKNILERVLLYPEDHDFTACINVLKSREKRMAENGLVSNIAARDSKVQNPKRKVFNSDLVYPHASLVAPKIEIMNLSSGTAEVTRRADCWMTYEEYCKLTSHLAPRVRSSWKRSDDDDNWPSYVLDKLRLYVEEPRRQLTRNVNSIFNVVHKTAIQ
ncbi:EF-hand calcium-binding domain-containing protein 12-like [Xenia sp. Carnegie-2017]|uniref:EF-hand calcium-binding domain-containing protein 12-like n=1 Tax=Xenia sp. Carnegie-2017 TaxID=2897299 RepID=UPI001F03A97F|nr:EF-hand calcium-binding domain-containing protein 12-like [Xenia sp. Carnegie-2017]